MSQPPPKEIVFENFFDNTPDPKNPPPIPDHTLIRHIASGAYGQVWLAKNVMGTYRAVKIVSRNSFPDARPFERELAGIRKFEPISRTHVGLIDILQVGWNEERGYFYYVMELADDQETGQQINPENYAPRTLRADLQWRRKLPIEETVKLGLNLSSALGHLHKNGLIHRDIKPLNIIFVHGVPKLADIGLVVEAKEARTFVGTEGYIPPEGPGTVQADIYSLGKVIYECATGKDRCLFPELPALPADDDTATGLLELHEVTLKACETDLEKRYRDCDALHDDLVVVQSGKSVRRLRGVEKRLALLTKVGIAAAIVTIVAIWALFFQREEARKTSESLKHEGFLRRKAEKLAEENRQRLYAAKINLAQQAYERSDLPTFEELIKSLRPREGEKDLRGFEWYYLRRLLYTQRLQLLAHTNGVSTVAFSPGGKILATAGGDGKIRFWDASSGVLQKDLPGHESRVAALAFSPDGKFLVSGAEDKVIKVWGVAGSRFVGSLTGHENRVSCLAFSPDGKILASASEGPETTTGTAKTRFTGDDSTRIEVKLWDFANETLLGELHGFTNGIMGLAFSPDGRSLATAGADGRVRLWNVAERQEQFSFSPHVERFTPLPFRRMEKSC